MKVVTEQELRIMDALDAVQSAFDALPYHINNFAANEKMEFSRRIKEAKNIVAIRAMLRHGDGLPAPKQTELQDRQKQLE